MTQPLVRPGLLVVVSSPSGTGKTTLCHKLLAEFQQLRFSVSCTTRKPRTGERDGVDYRFIDDAEFDRMIASGDFAEWAHVHGNRYGTTVTAVREALSDGRDVLFDIDYQGGRQLKSRFRSEAVLVFLLPPSLGELARRLRSRNTEMPEQIERRLLKAHEELKEYGLYDYLIVNDDLQAAYDRLRSVYLAAQCEIQRMGMVAEGLVKESEAR